MLESYIERHLYNGINTLHKEKGEEYNKPLRQRQASYVNFNNHSTKYIYLSIYMIDYTTSFLISHV